MQSLADPGNKSGMERYGIDTGAALVVRMPDIRKLGRALGKNHDLALQLWKSSIHEARILASVVDDPKKVTPDQMDSWTQDFNSWDVCDQVCGNLFCRTQWRFEKALEYSHRPEEFVKRAGFAMMAWIAVHDKKADDPDFEPFFERIEQEADDQRNFVKKAVNWALRQIGKRNLALRKRARDVAEGLLQTDSRSARWNANDTIRELDRPELIARLSRKGK